MVRGLRDANARAPVLQPDADEQRGGSAKGNDLQSVKDSENPTMADPVTHDAKMGETVDSNPVAPPAPSDFLGFDFAEMGHVSNSLFRSTGDWIRIVDGATSLRYCGPLSAPQAAIARWRKKWGPPAGDSVVTFVKNCMAIEESKFPDLLEALKRAFLLLSKKGAQRGTHLEECGLEAARGRRAKESDGSIRNCSYGENPLWETAIRDR